MQNDLVSALDLAGLPGGPFDDTVIDSAVAQLRARAGWHIAPVRTETISVNSWGNADLPLPSMRVLSVSAVRLGAVTYTGFTVTPFSLYRPGGWPVGTLSVDLTHGYDECPPELLGLVAGYVSTATSAAQASTVSRITVGSVSTDFRDPSGGGGASGLLSDPVLDRYTIPAGLA
jgi:hypothetical protein